MVINSTVERLVDNVANLEQKFKRNKKILNNLVAPEKWQSLPDMWEWLATIYAKNSAVKDPYHSPSCEFTYSELARQIEKFAAGLQHLGLNYKEKVSIFSENGARWLIADQGIIKTGAVNAVRSSSAPIEELIYILKHSESSVLIVETPELYKKLAPYLNEVNLKFVVVLWGKCEDKSVYSFDDVIALGEKNSFRHIKLRKDDVATIIYTSGTTGRPKGAMLSHGNILHQINNFNSFLFIKPKSRALSILPIWHAYERSCSYFLFSIGTTVIYTNLRYFKQDLKKYNPNILIAVPRLWESIYAGVLQELGKQFKLRQNIVKSLFYLSSQYIKARRIFYNLDIKNLNRSIPERTLAFIEAGILLPFHKLGDIVAYKKIRRVFGDSFMKGISGGGALAEHLEDFYEILGMEILVGYGLTETSPVLTVRNPKYNLKGSAGRPLPFTQIKILDPETMKELDKGQKGLVVVKGPQIMQGYYNDPESTKKVVNSERWFNTGDLGWLSKNNDLILTGRIKDLIVLSNGEKVEPQPIEDTCLQSDFVKQIMLTGQDQRSLGAVVVPDIDLLEKCKDEVGADISDLNNKKVVEFYQKELNQHIKNRSNYRPYELISTIKLVSEQFTIDNGLLTQTLKVKRSAVAERYSEIISEMFKSF